MVGEENLDCLLTGKAPRNYGINTTNWIAHLKQFKGWNNLRKVCNNLNYIENMADFQDFHFSFFCGWISENFLLSSGNLVPGQTEKLKPDEKSQKRNGH